MGVMLVAAVGARRVHQAGSIYSGSPVCQGEGAR
jgi:hypothetical protein